MAVTLQITNDGPRNHIVHMQIALANADAVVIDASAWDGPLTSCKVVQVDWSLTGGGATFSWDGAADVIFLELAEGEGDIDYRRQGGIINNAGTPTGDILLTNAAALTDGSVTLWCVKR